MPNPWFRFYSETLHDLKFDRLVRICNEPKALLLGIWVTLLSLANDSPIPGALLLTDDIPLTIDDIALEAGVDAERLSPIIAMLFDLRMLTLADGVWYVTNWDKRQFKSDSSRDRVRKFRAQKAQSQCNGDVTLPVTLHETLPSVSVSVSESGSSSSGERDKSLREEGGEEDSLDRKAYAVVLAVWAKQFPSKPQPRPNNKTLIRKTLTRMEDAYFREHWEQALARAARSKFLQGSSWFDLGWFVHNEDNWEKCLAGKYDDPSHLPKQARPVGLAAFDEFERLVDAEDLIVDVEVQDVGS